MKKLVALLLTLAMCLSLVACGVDKQPAVDAFNSASTAYDALVDKINANIDIHSDELIDTMAQVGASMSECKALLESDQKLTEEQVEELVKNLNDIESWIAEAETIAQEELDAAAE